MSIAEVISGNVRRAVIYSYMVDLGYFHEHCPKFTEIPRIDVIYGGKDACHELAQKHAARINSAYENVSVKVHLCKSSQAYGLHHSKLIILYYEEGVRIVISTANFIEADFENKTNAFWMQDFPKKTSRSKPMTDFEETLIHYLEKMKDVNVN
eukprot:UN25369